MLTTLRCPDGIILASCEWWLVNELGLQDWKTGAYVWVEQIELSQGVKSRQVIQGMIQVIAQLVPQAKSGYWFRKDKTGTRPHEYARQRLVKEEVRV